MTSDTHEHFLGAGGGAIPWRTASLCLLVTMFEGFDLQILGVIAPQIRESLSLTPVALGNIFGAATLGLLIGAIVSGFLADRIGRKPTLVLSIATFAVCTWVTSRAGSADQLALARFCTGIGLGGAMPSIASLAMEAVGKRSNVAFVTIMFAGMPLGGALSSLAVALWPGDVSWRAIFLVGGFLQLGLALLIWGWMPESRAFLTRNVPRKAMDVDGRASAAPGEKGQLDPSRPQETPGRLSATHWLGVVGLCIAFFFTLLSLHFFLNWLPSMLAAQGLSGRETALVSFAFGMSGAVGSLVVGWLVQIGRARIAMFSAYGCIAIASAAPWVFGPGLAGAFAIGSVVGFCLVGAQMTLYGLAPSVFPDRIRGAGVGATIAMGRFGSFVGPTVAGALLGAGWSQGDVMALNAPVAGLAALSVAVALSLARPVDAGVE